MRNATSWEENRSSFEDYDICWEENERFWEEKKCSFEENELWQEDTANNGRRAVLRRMNYSRRMTTN